MTGIDWRVSGRNRPDYKAIGFFNQAAFQNAALGTWGAAGRNVIRGPGFANMDLMIGKQFIIREGMRVQFRSEYFNVTNRVNFGLPQGNLRSSLFGQSTGLSGQPRQVEIGFRVDF